MKGTAATEIALAEPLWPKIVGPTTSSPLERGYSVASTPPPFSSSASLTRGEASPGARLTTSCTVLWCCFRWSNEHLDRHLARFDVGFGRFLDEVAAGVEQVGIEIGGDAVPGFVPLQIDRQFRPASTLMPKVLIGFCGIGVEIETVDAVGSRPWLQPPAGRTPSLDMQGFPRRRCRVRRLRRAGCRCRRPRSRSRRLRRLR